MKRRFRLYLDESGDHTYHDLDNEAKRYLGLIGCFIESEVYRATFHPTLEALKQKYFPHNPDEPVIFHRKDIVNRHGPFKRLRDSVLQEAFNKDLLSFFKEQDYEIIMVVIDKKAHIERYQQAAFHPYHFCLVAMMQRYCGFLNFNSAQGDVLAESRGGTEDRQLKEAYRRVYNSGTHFRHAEFFQHVLTSKEIKLKQKIANIAGLQIADLLAYPLKQEILYENNRIPSIEDTFGQEICKAVIGKYNRQVYMGKIYGYNKIFIK